MNYDALIEKAMGAMSNAYAPYSNFPVGAALLMENGTIYTGNNIENASYGLSICAERVALFKAISEGRRDFKAMAVVCDTDIFCSPCGACRQVLSEFASDMPIIMANNKKSYEIKTVGELMPEFFRKEHLQRRPSDG